MDTDNPPLNRHLHQTPRTRYRNLPQKPKQKLTPLSTEIICKLKLIKPVIRESNTRTGHDKKKASKEGLFAPNPTHQSET